MYYSDRTVWNRACANAVGHFQTLLMLPEGELPIHFTKGGGNNCRLSDMAEMPVFSCTDAEIKFYFGHRDGFTPAS